MGIQHEFTTLGKNAAIESAAADLTNPDFLKSENASSRLGAHAQDRANVWAYNMAIKSKTAIQAYTNTYFHLVSKAKSEADFLAKPLFDGTEVSCRNRNEYRALYSAFNAVTATMADIDKMADYITRKMTDIKSTLRRYSSVETEKNRFDVTTEQAASYCGLNSLGELQGNGNIDALIVKLHAKKEAFANLVYALGYRLTNDPNS